MSEMSLAEVNEFLRGSLIARVATVRPDGRPHVVPVWFEWDDGALRFETPPNFQKAKNLAHDSRLAVAIDVTEGGLRFKAVVMEGRARIIQKEGDVTPIVARIYRKYLGEAIEAATPQRMIYHSGPHIIVELQPDRILSWDDTSSGAAPLS